MPLGTSPSGSPVYPPLSHLSARFARSAVQLDLLVGGGWKHLDLAVPCLLSIGNPRYGADRSVRRLLVGRKTRNGVFSAAPRQKGAKNAKKEESESFLKQKVKRLCKKEQQDVGNLA